MKKQALIIAPAFLLLRPNLGVLALRSNFGGWEEWLVAFAWQTRIFHLNPRLGSSIIVQYISEARIYGD